MSKQDKYNKILKQYFNYDKLKPEQYQIIDSLISDKKDVCAILATGFGKSICFQMPYLITRKSVIIISPLIALMEDQVTHMEELNIPVCSLNSNCKFKRSVKDDILEGNNKLIYITPEYVQHCEEFFTQLYEQEQIELIAIDESHCVSTYGNDFRPSYKELKVLRDWMPTIPILAVTATASDKVKKDIIKFLQLKDPLMVVGNFDRPNLFIQVEKISYANTLDPKILKLLKKYKDEYIIVYCKTKNDTEKVAELIDDMGISCKAYHAGMSGSDRSDTQQQFIEGEIKCIVATIAFGMGINVPNVRLVIHYGCPKNLESYYQEIGRAGRDGKPSECHLFFSSKDFIINRFFLKQITDEKYRSYQEEQIKIIEKYVYTQECRRKLLLDNFGGKVTSCINCDNCTIDKSTIKKINATYPAYLFLSCVKNLDNNFGATTIINILRGSNAKNISKQMKQLNEYNSGGHYSCNWWKLLIRDLINLNYITEKAIQKARFGSVILCTPAGLNWLKNINTKYEEVIETTAFTETEKIYMSDTNSNKVTISEPKTDFEIAMEIMQNDLQEQKEKKTEQKQAPKKSIPKKITIKKKKVVEEDETLKQLERDLANFEAIEKKKK